MLKNNVRFVDRERREIVNPDELYFEKLEKLSMKKIMNRERINNPKVNNDSANLIYRIDIKGR